MAVIEDLSEEELGEILHRLPLRSLLQCKSVSKRFLHMISDPQFLHPRPTHHQLLTPSVPLETQQALFILFHVHSGSISNKIMLFSVDSNTKTHILKGSSFLPRSWPQDRDRIRVKATHHDLLLCSTQSTSHTHYFICNPFTKQYVALPPIRKSHAHEVACVGFICDQSRSVFRVLHIPIICFRYVLTFQVNMFLSETGEWCSANVTIPDRQEVLMSKSFSEKILVYNGKFVWVVKKSGVFLCDPFDDWDSKCRLISMDDVFIWTPELKEFDVCHGRVKTCVFSRMESKSRVFELVNFEEERPSIKVHLLDTSIVRMKNDMKFLAFHPHCEYMMYCYSNKGVFLFDCENQKLESVYTVAAGENIRVTGNVMSLVLPPWPTPIPTVTA